ncbi:MAG: MFS transporter, partial [Dehalococcoidia bacterium]|nr:MFS transporter [Dehalococcoidia bacterium]
YRWKIIAAAAFCYLIFAVVLQSIPPILGILIDMFHISYAEAGVLMSLALFPAIVLSIPGGLLVDRFGVRITGTVSLAIMMLGTVIVAMGNSYLVLSLGRLIVGLGATGVVVALPKIITAWFAGREIGLAMGVYHTAFPLGTILALNFAGILAYGLGWQVPIWGSAVLCAVALLLFISFIRDKKGEQSETLESSNLLGAIKEAGWKIWCVGIAWAFFAGCTISYFTYAPDYFISSGKDVAQAGLIASAPMFGSIVLAALVGKLVDRIGKKWLFAVIGLAGIALMLFLIPRFTNHAALLAVSMGIFIALFTPASFAMPADIVPERVRGVGFGIILTCQGFGNVLAPALVGLLRDITGNYWWSFAAMFVMALLGIIPIVVIAACRKTKR